MNIGFDAKRALFNRSGLGNYSRSTMRLLAHFYPESTYYLYSGKQGIDLFQAAANQHIITPDSAFSRTFPSLWRSWGIQKQLRQQKLDIFHGLSNELPLGIKKTGVKTVVTIHDLIFLRFPGYYPVIDRQIYLQKFRHACQVADRIIAISEATKLDIISFLGIDPHKIDVVYQTCDPIFRLPVTEAEKESIRNKYELPQRYILYLGTIEKRKNALSLIKAYQEAEPDIPLLIAGRPTGYMNEINAHLNKSPGKERIIFRHTIETPDLPALYQSAEVFVYPSVFEGFGIPILEALYSKVPVITSTGSCFSETGGDAALYCDPYDTEQMVNCLKQVLDNTIIKESMIAKGIEYARRFDEANVAANLMKVYTGLK